MRFTTKISILAVLAILITHPGYAMHLPQDDSARAAFELLLKADIVKGSAVGFAGLRPKEYDAFETLWKAGKASEDYALKLISEGTPAGRMYGAILLLEIDEMAARREFKKLKDEKTQVHTQSGCVIIPHTVGDLIQKLDNGEWIIIIPTGRRRQPK